MPTLLLGVDLRRQNLTQNSGFAGPSLVVPPSVALRLREEWLPQVFAFGRTEGQPKVEKHMHRFALGTTTPRGIGQGRWSAQGSGLDQGDERKSVGSSMTRLNGPSASKS